MVEDAEDASEDGAEGTGPSDEDVAMSQSDASGIVWLATGVLVAVVVSLLLVGAVIEEPIANQAAALAIGFAWLLAATYVGFRIEGSSRLRLAGASSFVLAAVAHFLSLLYQSSVLDGIRIVAVLVGAVILLVLVRR